MKFSKINDYPEPKHYKSGSKEYYLDRTKNILRRIIPEERVRQKCIEYLKDKYGLSYLEMDTEYSLTDYKRSDKRRMDIFVKSDRKGRIMPIMVVECKKPKVKLDDLVNKQASEYAIRSKTKIVMITNGEFEAYYKRYYSTYKEEIFPESYEDLVQFNKYKSSKITYDFQGNDICEFTNRDELILNLHDCFLDVSQKIKKLKMNNYEFVEDLGVSWKKISIYADYVFEGYIRSFLIKDKNKKLYIVSIDVDLDYSYLNVYIDNQKMLHCSIEMYLNQFMRIKKNKCAFYHDGRINVGNTDFDDYEEMLEYAIKKGSFNKKDDKIELGTININKYLYVNDKDVKSFIANIIEYALIRDEFRKIVKKRYFKPKPVKKWVTLDNF